MQLNAALARDPQQVEGWLLLGQAYQRTGNTNGARDAFAKAAALAPDDADILTQAAQLTQTQAQGLAHRELVT